MNLRMSVLVGLALAGSYFQFAVAAEAGAAVATPPSAPVATASTAPAPSASTAPTATPADAMPGAVVQVPPVAAATTVPAAQGAGAAPVLPVAVPAANALPPMNFYASVAEDELFDQVRGVAAFSKVEKDLVGSPILLRVSHTLRPTAGGTAAGLLSAIWAGSTLGLLPVVTNNNLVLTYEVKVNGKEVLRRDFQRSFTRAMGIWNAQADPTHGLGQEGLDWAKTTAAEFASTVAGDPALVALSREYQKYFGAPAAP